MAGYDDNPFRMPAGAASQPWTADPAGSSAQAFDPSTATPATPTITADWLAVWVAFGIASAATAVRVFMQRRKPPSERMSLWQLPLVLLPACYALLVTSHTSGFHAAGGALLACTAAACGWCVTWAWRRRAALLATRAARLVAVCAVLWVGAVQLWGLIWEWDDFFSPGQFTLLTVGVPALLILGAVGFRWAGRGA